MTNDYKNSLYSLKQSHFGRVSFFTPQKASITVEAAIAVPIFFFAVICLIYLFEIMAIQTAVRGGLHYAAKVTMEESTSFYRIDAEKIEEDVVTSIGTDRIERSIIFGGIDCSESKVSLRTGIGTLVAKYSMKIPVPLLNNKVISREESMKIKLWTGYEKEYFGSEEDETVYITETGLVYHKDYHCTYLDLSVHMVLAENIAELRNKNGARYYACWLCKGQGSSYVYITDNGNRYHNTVSCSGLKRTVYAVSLSEVVGKGACTRCGQ